MIKLSTLKPNPGNPRLIKDDKFNKLVKSLETFPQMMELRPIIVDENNVIQGGNMRFKALQKLGFKEIPDNYVKQGKDLTPEQWKEFVIKDNVGFGEWHWDVLANEWNSDELVDWGLDLPGFDIENKTDDSENNYSRKIEAPIYKPTKEKAPEIVELFDSEKYKLLISEIENSSLNPDVKDFLKVAACRHIVFNYANIAEYYSHADKQLQELMENSALVIIDFNKAIELGYVKLSEEIAEQYREEYGDDE